MKATRVRVVVGVVLGLCFWLGWSSATWADDDEGGGGDEPAPAPEPAAPPERADPPADDPRADEPAPADENAAPADHPAAPGGDTPADDDRAAAGPDGDGDGDGNGDSTRDRDGDDPAADGDGDRDSARDGDDPTAGAAAGARADAPGGDDDTPAGAAATAAAYGDGDAPPYVEYDLDGDGRVEADEAAFEQAYEAAFAAIPDEITDDALDARDPEHELTFSLTAEQFRTLVRLAKAKVLPRLEATLDRKQAKRMTSFTLLVCACSALGVLLLAMPLVLRRKYPGQDRLLWRYAGLAAGTWVVTVLLFGAVLFGMRSAQGALSGLTNPQLAIAGGVFDTLDRNAEEYLYTGKELFAPTLEQLQGNADEQPAVALLANGVRIVEDAKVFVSMARLFSRVDWLFAMLPIVLLVVTLVLMALALKPTLVEIVKVPTRAAAGEAGVGQDVMKRSMARVVAELKATAATVGVLTLLTLVSAFVLGRIVGPALDGLLRYFSMAVSYLQFVEGASSGMVFMALFGAIFFLVLNLATLILSMTLFLGKTQKIFQQRFNAGTPLAAYRRFFRWAIPAVLFVQLFPLLFVLVAERVLHAINANLLAGVTDAADVNWTALLLVGPLFLVVAYVVAFWAARGVKAIRFIQAYRIRPFDRPLVEAPPQGDRSGEITEARAA